ncbi:MAG TPA: hypothetical protein VD948_09690, partial [Rhodothermales bacterium]|nr:hypothetical protein [Rhodothermales bacterium]
VHNLQDAFAEDAARAPSGITPTDARGTPSGTTDTDDWRTAPVYAGRVTVSPAYPNPVSSGDFVSLPVSILDFDGVFGGLTLQTYDANRRLRTLAVSRENGPGAFVLSFSAALLGRTGLHRLYLFDGRGQLVSYGDLEVR